MARFLRRAGPGLAAYREIALAAKGLEIAYLQFVFRGLTLAVCSRVRRDGIVEIEMGLGDPRLPRSTFTAAQMRQAEAAFSGAERRRASRPASTRALISCQRRHVVPLPVLAHAVRLHFRGCVLMLRWIAG
jgi:hypothetical protein